MTTPRFPVAETRALIFSPEKRAADAIACLHEWSDTIDRHLSALLATAADTELSRSGCCLIAVGGYGRREMCPYSDVDIMLLYTDKVQKSAINAFERAAWDTGFLLGFSARTLAECSKILGDEDATDMALLDARLICGDADLYKSFIRRLLKPYFKRTRWKWLLDIRSTLLSGALNSAHPLYRIEPDLKNGVCGLRDGQRIRWAAKIAHGAVGYLKDQPHHYLASDDIKLLDAAYDFTLKLRTELHMQSGRRLDILEVGLQQPVALAAGYGEHGQAELMSDFFKMITDVRTCIFSVSEQIAHERNSFANLRSTLASIPAGSGFRVMDGILYPSSSRHPADKGLAAWTLSAFKCAISFQTAIGLTLRKLLTQASRKLVPEDFRNRECEEAFRIILSSTEKQCGSTIQVMHDTRILDLLLPEFAPLTCRVEYDTYHEYTVDQHTLSALSAFDLLSNDNDELVRTVRRQITSYRVFRLALLLHDAGKSLDGDHCRSGSIIARNASARLGFTEEEQAQVEFLVYHHLDMSELSLRRETDAATIQTFADSVGSTAMLDMLYLLTTLDIRHVSTRAMTGWKAVQLAEIHALTTQALEGKTPLISDRRQTGYASAFLPEDRATHEKWLGELAPDGLQLHTEAFTGFFRITVVTHDRTSLLADIAACFIAAGLQIISAHVYSLDAGVVDVFDVEPEEATSLPLDERIERFNRTWQLLRSGASSQEVVQRKLSSLKQKARRHIAQPPVVHVNNNDSAAYSIVEVRAPDRFGLFYSLVNAFSSHGVNIGTARIATAVDVAIDVFFITGAAGGKITGEEEMAKLRQVVLGVLG